jgi:hypothetical protein
VLIMANPLLTIAFDLFVILGTAALFAGAIAQARAERRGAIRASRPIRNRATQRPPTHVAARPARVRRRLAA